MSNDPGRKIGEPLRWAELIVVRLESFLLFAGRPEIHDKLSRNIQRDRSPVIFLDKEQRHFDRCRACSATVKRSIFHERRRLANAKGWKSAGQEWCKAP